MFGRIVVRQSHVRHWLSFAYSRRHTSSFMTGLHERGLVKTITSPNLESESEKTTISLYCGVDPTAPSLHVGNLLTLIPVLHFYLNGHNAFALVGGATGKVGDPAGKTSERSKLASDVVSQNVASLSSQLQIFFENGLLYAQTYGYSSAQPGKIQVVNNADWYSSLKFMDFMNDVGRNVRLSSMLARDSVKGRLSGDGMSFGEFAYQLLQAYDFWQLHRTHGVRLQIGGSDQYGNITAGIDLITRLQQQQQQQDGDAVVDNRRQEIFGLTVPLLTTPSGEKFGKSAGNAIWLDSRMTSPFDLYQYFLKTPDSHLESYLKLFTLIPVSEIADIMQKHNLQPSQRLAHRILARDLIVLVHGVQVYEKIDMANRILFPGDFQSTEVLSAEVLLKAFQGDESVLRRSRAAVLDTSITKVLKDCGIVKSGREAHQLISGGGLSCAGNRISDAKAVVGRDWLIDDRVLLLKMGKNKFAIIELQ